MVTSHDLHVNLIPILAPNNFDYFKIGFDNLIFNKSRKDVRASGPREEKRPRDDSVFQKPKHME